MKILQRVLITYPGNRHAIDVLFRNAHGKAKCQVCLFAMQKGRPVFFSSFLHGKRRTFFSALTFYHENRQKKRLVDLFTRAKGQAVFFSGFLQWKRANFFCAAFWHCECPVDPFLPQGFI